MSPIDLYFMPYTQSLLGTAGWALGFGQLVGAIMRSRVGGLIAGAVVMSHWLLDFVTHRPDLGLLGDSHKVGLGLRNPTPSPPCRSSWRWSASALPSMPTLPGCWRLWVVAAVLLAMQSVDWFGPKPTQVDAMLPLQALAAYAVAIALAWWVDTTREHAARTAGTVPPSASRTES